MAKRENPLAEILQSQQEALASFGELTLKSSDLDEILHEACRLIGSALNTDLAKVMELQADGVTLLVRAGVGWKDDVVGHVRVQAEEDTSEGYALLKGEPTISTDIEKENRFRYPGFMDDHAVKAFVNVPIMSDGGTDNFGILEVDSRSPREFTTHDIAFLRIYANLLAATIERLKIIKRLEKAVEDKERLVVEMQHRTKNSLQLISGFVRLRLKNAASDDAREQLDSVAGRIETVHILHEKLYSTGEIENLDLGAYLSDLASSLVSVHANDVDIRLQVEVENIYVPAEIAMPIGLILNEFITNSLKYAFDEGNGSVGVELMSSDNGTLMRIWDDGKGLPSDIAESGGTGIRLINALAQQINAKASWSSEGGTFLHLDLAG